MHVNYQPELPGTAAGTLPREQDLPPADAEPVQPHVPMHVRLATAADYPAWDAYVTQRSTQPLMFRTRWDQVFAAYGLPTMRLVAVRADGQIAGVLPLVRQQSWWFGKRLVSLPWFDAAGVLADDQETSWRLVAAAQAAASNRGIVELRQLEPADYSCDVRTDKVLMRLRLPASADDLWESLSSKVRNQIRKAQKSGLEVLPGTDAYLDDFYRVYSENMRDLGSPSHHRRFLTSVLNAFPEETRLYVVRLGRQTMGVAWTMANGNCLEIPWASSLKRYNSYCVNHGIYWQILADACGQGFDWFHFGRSSQNSGTYHYKKQWGAEPAQLYWYYLSKQVPPTVLSNSSRTVAWGSTLWKRLPLPVARWLGPRVIAKVS